LNGSPSIIDTMSETRHVARLSAFDTTKRGYFGRVRAAGAGAAPLSSPTPAALEDELLDAAALQDEELLDDDALQDDKATGAARSGAGAAAS
jgi:hypothetical protein